MGCLIVICLELTNEVRASAGSWEIPVPTFLAIVLLRASREQTQVLLLGGRHFSD